MCDTIIILAGGASSRMKKETTAGHITQKDIAQANTRNKGLIEVGEEKLPFLHYLLYNIKQAGHTNVFIVIGQNDQLFPAVYGRKKAQNEFNGLSISFVRQYIPKDRDKPLGTADALFQAMEQYPELKASSFLVCNCDNLYSVKALLALNNPKYKNALLGYDSEGLHYEQEKIERFALMKLDAQNRLVSILEKPRSSQVKDYRDGQGKLRVSMNIFKFDGQQIYPFLRDCPLHSERNEKELPTALLNMVTDFPESVVVIPICEHVIDLTSKEDIAIVNDHLKKEYPNGLQW